MRKKKIIVFGATGNVGSYVLRYALSYFADKPFEVIASGRRQTEFFSRRGIPYISVDVSQPEAFAALPTEDVYAVIDLAAQIPSYMEGYDPRAYDTSNLLGAYNIIDYCRRVHADRILFSTTVFDISLHAQQKPRRPLAPDLSPAFDYAGDHAVYVITKNTTIEFLKHAFAQYGLKYFIFRFPTIYNYSPYHYYFPNGVKTKRPVYLMIERAMAGEPIELWGDPHYAKDMVYVDDCAQMLCKAVEAERDTGVYNVGTGVPVTLEEQIQTIIDVFSPKTHPSEIVYRPDKTAGGGFLMDVTNAKRELGYEPQYDVRRLFEAYREEMRFNRFAELRRKV